MERYFNYKAAFDGITVQLCNSVIIEEGEMHSYHEILFCEGENLKLRTENQKREFRGENLFIIPKGKYHSFDLTGLDEFFRLKLSISDEVARSYSLGIFSSELRVSSSISQLQRLLIGGICDHMQSLCDGEGDFYLRSSVMMLLAEMNRSTLNDAPLDTRDGCEKRIIDGVIQYISEHISSDLSVDALSKISSTSPSYLTHNFKKEVGISLHRYILQKRMIYARERIESGERPTKIYTDCGYSDYSSFYKAYVKYFKESPSP